MPQFIPPYLGVSTPDITLSGTNGADLNVGAGGVLGSAAFSGIGNFMPADTGTAWASYAPAVASAGGSIATLGTVSGRYKTIGKTAFVQMTINITTNGTGSGYIKASLPFPATHSVIYGGLCGQENAVNGKMLMGIIDPAVSSSVACITFYDNTYPGSNGCRLCISGSYETA